jgi:hypothetical protein
MARLTAREEAEAIEQFGDDLLKLCKPFCDGFSLTTVDRVNEVPNQEQLEIIAKAFQSLGAQISLECDEAEEADDRRRDNPLERDFRRLGE